MTYFLLAAVTVAFIAAIIDWRTGHIPNALTFGALGAALVAHFAHGYSFGGPDTAFRELGIACLGALTCAAVPLLMYALGGMGGGDLKLFAALGAFAMPLGGLEAETYAFIAALLIAPARLAFEGTLFRTLRNTLTLVLNPLRPSGKRKPIPQEMQAWFRLGPSIFVGALAALVAHWNMP